MWKLSVLAFFFGLSISVSAEVLPLVYVTGPSSVCPGVPYTYQLYTNGCAIDSYTWNITGGTITSQGPPGPPGPIEAAVIQTNQLATTQASINQGVVTSVSIIWTSAGSKSVSADITTICNQTVAGFVNGVIAFSVPGLQPAAPIAPKISGSKFCVGQSVGLDITPISENANGSSTDDVYIIWEVSINGGAFTYLDIQNTGNFNYTFTALAIPGSYVFRARKYYQLCSNTQSDPGSNSPTVTLYPPAPTISSATGNAPTCPGSEGSITIVHGPGTALNSSFVYTITGYVYKNGAGGCPPPFAGNNTLDLTDANGLYPANLSASGTYCSGSTGSFTKTFSNVGQLSYTITSLQSLDTGTPLFLPGIYKIKIESAGYASCFATYYIQIPPALPTPSIIPPDITVPACNGGNDGTATFKINGRGKYDASNDIKYTLKIGNAVYGSLNDKFINLTGAQFTIGGLVAGTYELTVWDVCHSDPMIIGFTIPPSGTSLALSTPSGNNKSDPTCNANGAFTISVNQIGSYTSGYVYELYDPSLKATTTTGTSTTFSSLSDVPNYQVKVTSPNGCTDTENVQLSPPPAIDGTTSAVDNTCYGGSAGRVIFSKTSGSTSLSFSTSPTSSSGNNYYFDGLAKGTYAIRVTDDCLASTGRSLKYKDISQFVNSPGNPLSFLTGGSYVYDNQVYKIACYDGGQNVDLGFQYGTAPYNVKLYKNGVDQGNTDHTLPITFTNLGINPNASDKYSVSVTDACSANISLTFFVKSNASGPLAVAITKPLYSNSYNLTCPENDDGRIQVDVSGGVQGSGPRYKVELLNAASTSLIDNISNSSNSNGSVTTNPENAGHSYYTFSNLKEGIAYQIRVTDYNVTPGNCVQTFSKDTGGNNLALTSPAALTLQSPAINTDFSGLIVYNSNLYVQCKNGSSGVYTAHMSGGNPSYTVSLYKDPDATPSSPPSSWPSSALSTTTINSTTTSFSNLGTGWYKVVLTDIQSCTPSIQTFRILEAVSVLQVEAITAKVFSHGANTTCYGDSDGSITITASGGVGDYSYILTSDAGYSSTIIRPESTQTFTSLPAIKADGSIITYTIGLKDALGCAWNGSTPVSSTFQLIPPAKVGFTYQIMSRTLPGYEIPCKGDDAVVRITSGGGKEPYFATIGGTTKQIDDPTKYVEFSLPALTYSITLKDNLQCAASPQPLPLKEPASHIGISALLTGDLVPPICIGGVDGEINLKATGGITFPSPDDYIFLIKKSGALDYDTDTLRGAAVKFIRAANSYDAMSIDKHGCTHEMTGIALGDNPAPLTLQYTKLFSPTCYGATNGYITLKASNYDLIGGTSLKFKLSGGHLGNTVIETLVTSNTHTFTNLEGTDLNGHTPYRAWVEDIHACADTAFQYLPSLTLPSYTPVTLSLVKSIRPSCFNGSDGSLLLKVMGGVAPYKISRDNQTYTDVDASGLVFIPGLINGNYRFYLKDANFDPAQSTCLTVTAFDVAPGRVLRLDVAVNKISCKGNHDGSIDLTTNLDNRNGGENFDLNRLSLYWTQDNVSSLPIAASEDLSLLTKGTYTVHAAYDVDSLICRTEKSVVVSEPAVAFHITELKTYEASCGTHSDGKAIVTITGGWPGGLQYYKVDGGSWTAFSGSSFALAQLALGDHSVSISQSGFTCVNTKMFTIESKPLLLSVHSIISPACPLESTGAVVLSSEANVMYSMNGGAFQLLSVFDGLAKGTYHFVARRSAETDCESEIIDAIVKDPVDCGNGALQLNLLGSTAATCKQAKDGEANVIALGGVPPYHFFWDGSTQEGVAHGTGLGEGAHSVLVKDALNTTLTLPVQIQSLTVLSVQSFTSLVSCANTCDGTASLVITGGSGQYNIVWSNGATTSTLSNLCAGTYTFTIHDVLNNTCKLSDKVIVVSQPAIEIVQQSAVSPICPGGTDGFVSANISGGSGQYDLQWNTGEIVSKLTGHIPGTYSLLVKDKVLGCSLTKDFQLPDALPITVTSEIITSPSCTDGQDGKVQLILNNVTLPLVQWSDGQLGLIVTNLKAGDYQYTITSASGCSTQSNVLVPDKPKLQVTSNVINPTCYGTCNGEISLTISGGSAPYAIHWAHGPALASVKNLCEGSYTYTVTDKYNCITTGTVKIKAPDAIAIAVDEQVNPSCSSSSDGTIQVSAKGGTGTYLYVWNTGGNTSVLNSQLAGTYKITVSDKNQCTASRSVQLIAPPLLQLSNDKIVLPLCPQSQDGSIAPNVLGGTLPYTYNWEDQTTEAQRKKLLAGTYTLKVTDKKGCEVKKEYTLKAPLSLELVNVKKNDPLCYGDRNGSISVDAIGGIAPYAFSWTQGAKVNHIENVTAGSYKILVTDKNGCSIEQLYTLTDPELPVITGIAAKTILCTGSKTTLSPDGLWTKYLWSNAQNALSSSSKYETGVPGTYTLTTWDTRNCPAKTAFEIEVSDNVLHADFLRLSEAFTYQPVVFVDISVPLPGSTEWIVPDDHDVIVNNKNEGNLELVFSRSGEFEIGLKAKMDNCFSSIFKKVEVKEAPKGTTPGGRVTVSDKLELLLYPNPASDQMNVQVTSSSREPIEVYLVSGITGLNYFNESLEGQLDYLVRWDVSAITAGVYQVVIRQNGKIKSKTMVIVK